jgi:hypothetical protein
MMASAFLPGSMIQAIHNEQMSSRALRGDEGART